MKNVLVGAFLGGEKHVRYKISARYEPNFFF
jgi:hypothetical protein